MTKLPAGNSHRHQQPEDSTLWDRLRADLNNLGAAYGPITEGVGEAVVTPEPVEIYERAAWDLPITFTARLGGRTP